jgi:formylglycine-generating enzyme required for sulfatase activity
MKPNHSLQNPLDNCKPVAASVSGEGHNRLGWKVLMPLFALGIVFCTLFAGTLSALAQGTAFTYQGHLSDAGQTANGSYDLTFALFGSDSGGMAVADTLTNSPTAVSNGLFTVVLDFGANVFNGQPRWLEIAVRTNGSAESYTILSPRQELTATPYAITASNLSGMLPASQLSGLYSNAVTFNNPTNTFAGTFSGDGSGLTNLDIAQLGGILPMNGLMGTYPNAVAFNNPTNAFAGSFAGTFSGDGSGLTNVDLGGTQPPPAVTPGLTMVWIKPGTFVMGSPTGEVDHFDYYEGPQTVVTLTRGFWMGQHLVTQGEYVTAVGSNPSFFTGDLNLPVESVAWSDATNYCGLLTQSERTAGRLPANWGYRLPTNAEWEYACRALTTTRTYWGDDPGYTNLVNQAWYNGNSNGQTHPVGQKPLNPWGLADMEGNLWEWCQDYFEVYPGGSVTDPQGPASDPDGRRVGRGGSWYDDAIWCRSAARYDFLPDNPWYPEMMGFRVVLARSQ